MMDAAAAAAAVSSFAGGEASHCLMKAESPPPGPPVVKKANSRRRRKPAAEAEDDAAKRRCVSTACIACRRRKSKCDGATPSCAACSQVYGTDCIYDPNSDHRRKGVYKNDVESPKMQDSTLHTLIQAILNYAEDDVPALVREIRTCESLDAVAEKIVAKENGLDLSDEDDADASYNENDEIAPGRTFETQLYGKMGDLRMDDGSVRYIGGTSNFIHLGSDDELAGADEYQQQANPTTSWTDVTDDEELVNHLLHMYFTWHYTYFTTMSKQLFYRDFNLGMPPDNTRRKTWYCTPLLVNAILAIGCHFTSRPDARSDPNDSATAGDHFFREAKRLMMENDEYEKPKLTTVQALALMSVREAGCGREAKGWVYSGMSFRMACDMGLNIDSGRITSNKHVNGDEAEEDVRRVTFWGCYLFDKCWSNYLGRLPQLPTSIATVLKPDVFPDEDSSQWSPYTDSGYTQAHSQPARTRAVALQITKLCEISNDLLKHFYNPTDMEKTKGKASELKKLSDIHTRLESWRRELPKELEPKEGGLSSVLVMHMFFQLLFIHLFRPFLKYNQATSPLPPNVSPRKLCTQAAAMISKLMRLYKRSHGLRQICNIAVYICHSACTIHLLNLPDKNAKRDIVHGVKHLEEIAEGWLCARRTLGVLSVLSRKWSIELPEEAANVLARTDAKFSHYVLEVSSESSPSEARRPSIGISMKMIPAQLAAQQNWYKPATIAAAGGSFNGPVPTAPTKLAMVHAQNSEYTLPPHDSYSLQAQPYPSATPTPSTNVNRNSSRNSVSGKSAGSPSDLFGGVEQLIRDSRDWVMRDQAQFAMGFENWNTPGNVDIDPATWAANGNNGVVSSAAAVGLNGGSGVHHPPSLNGGAVGDPHSARASISMPTNGNGGPFSLNGGGGAKATTAEWLSHMNHMAMYDENEWYQ